MVVTSILTLLLVLVAECPASVVGVVTSTSALVEVVERPVSSVTSTTRISVCDLVEVVLLASIEVSVSKLLLLCVEVALLASILATILTSVVALVLVVDVPSSVTGTTCSVASALVCVRDLHLIGATSMIRMSDFERVSVLLLACRVVLD